LDVGDPRTLDALMRRHGIRAATSIGQHFLVDPEALAAIIDAAELGGTDDVLEIGPGPGVLTAAIAARARSVTAVEVDHRMVALLRETQAGRENVRVVEADALAIDLFSACARPPSRIVANLPYQITSPLLIRFLSDDRRPRRLVVLVQAEVARRIVATEDDAKERGYLSVFCQSFASVRIIRAVGRGSFRPPPRVDSAVVLLEPWELPRFAPLAAEPFLRLVSDVFRHRRKQLRAALGYEAGIGRERATAALGAAGIDPLRRPEQLSVDEWIVLARALA